MTYANPVLPGSHPDPSICRAGDDFYLVTSTFAYFPGLALHHSRDLVHWRPLGHVLDRPEQLPLHGVRASGGLYAPTIRFHDGLFHVVCTLVDGPRHGNFVVTARDPAGAWSAPVWLPDATGFDPSLFFDDDGRAWWTATREAGPGGRTEVWLREYDPVRQVLVGEEHVLWRGALRDAVWAEGPHLYKVDGRYVLLCAEGGTGFEHAVVVAFADRVTGPYRGSPLNPVLTHRHLGRGHPIAAVGHADLVETPGGRWHAVLLGTRPYGGYHYNLGRETFLVPVTWEDGGPVFGRVEARYPLPDLPPAPWPEPPPVDDFAVLGPRWQVLRTPDEPFWATGDGLRLRVRPETLAEPVTPSFVGRRQQHCDVRVSCELAFTPASPSEAAGLVVLQNDAFHLRLLRHGPRLTLVRRVAGRDEELATAVPDADVVRLAFDVRGQDYQAWYATGGPWRRLGGPVDGRPLANPVADDFTGMYFGLYATSHGEPSTSWARFAWFEYAPGIRDG